MSPNTRAQLLAITRSIFESYGDSPSDELLARNYECSVADARAFWEDLLPEVKAITRSIFESYGDSPIDIPAPKAAKAKAQPKKRTKKRVVHQAAQQVEKTLEKIHEPPVWAIRLLAGIVAVILIVRPIGYAIDYFGRSNDPWLAWGMALGLAGGAFISPQVLILGFKNRSVMTALTGLVMMTLSIWSSIQVTQSELSYLRARTQVAYVEHDTAAQESAIKRGAAQSALDTANANLAVSRGKVEAITKRGEFLMDGTPEFWTWRSDLKKATEAMEVDKKKADEKQVALDAIPVVVASVGVTKEDGRKADLGYNTDLAFAITQDVVGPLMLSMALFLRKRLGVKKWFWSEWFKKKPSA